MATATAEYLSCAETAKLVRQALKREFPAVKFSVQSNTYSMGASIRVNWTDGPRTKQVEAVAGAYAGADFDGMIDLKTYSSHYLRADGTPYVHHARGTEGSRGSIPETDNRALAPLMPPDVRVVRFGADYVSCSRNVSDFDAKVAQAADWLRTHCKIDGAGSGEQFGNRYVSDIGRSMAHDYIPGEDWTATFHRFCYPHES